MEVVKRNGNREAVSFDKITERLSKLMDGHCGDSIRIAPLSAAINVIDVVKAVIGGVHDGITTSQLDILSADTCASMIHKHPDFNWLASRVLISNLHKQTSSSFSEVTNTLHCMGLLDDRYHDFVMANKDALDAAIHHERDYLFDSFGYRTLERSYLFNRKEGKKVVILERPQYMWMRVAVQIHGSMHYEDSLENVLETYSGLSQMFYTHATPTLFNAGTKRQQMSSCFLTNVEDDISSIFSMISNVAHISKYAGGIGMSITPIRAKGSLIRSTNGLSDGIVPMCKVIEATARYINQGGKRLGSVAVYLEPWHADVFDFVDLRKPTGDENLRCRDLFLALWVPDEFMRRVEADEDWYLMCPDKQPGLVDAYGDDFDALYNRYIAEGKYMRKVRARELWNRILEAQIETGMPYMSYKDHVNRKSNQSNLGTIRNSNLCNEIVEFSSRRETAVCNLASICLPKFVNADRSFDFDHLQKVVRNLVRNLNNIVDLNYYPIPETERSNRRHRPIGIGIQGLADVFIKMRLPFESEDANRVNSAIMEHIQYAALDESCSIAEVEGSYDSYDGSPAARGMLQNDLWGVESTLMPDKWQALRRRIDMHGLHNSLLTALMPTASTAQICGNTESFEPITSNIYIRKTLAGEFVVVNEHLVRDLMELGLWSKDMYDTILYFNGSIQAITDIPLEIRELYKTAFEIRQSAIIRQAAARGPWVDQTQSMNLFMKVPDFVKLTSAHFAGWKAGLKTGMYYLRTQPAADPIKFGLDHSTIKRIQARYRGLEDESPKACARRRKGEPIEDCDVCSA